MPFDLQTRLLRVLSDGHYYRVGGHDPIRANVRIIAATHQNLEARVSQGLFREDLLHRLNVIRIRLPALRERSEDIPALARHFMTTSAKSLGVEAKRLSDDAIKAISQMTFPGNVRQLENLCHWMTVMSPSTIVGVNDLPEDLLLSANAPVSNSNTVTTASPTMPAAVESVIGSRSPDWEATLHRLAVKMLQDNHDKVFDSLLAKFEKSVLMAALEVTRGRKVEAATRLGIGRNTITRKLQELDIDA
jgi:two-component system nitrogen regulation response regulator GlnG